MIAWRFPGKRLIGKSKMVCLPDSIEKLTLEELLISLFLLPVSYSFHVSFTNICWSIKQRCSSEIPWEFHSQCFLIIIDINIATFVSILKSFPILLPIICPFQIQRTILPSCQYLFKRLYNEPELICREHQSNAVRFVDDIYTTVKQLFRFILVVPTFFV